ncbi:AN1-type zinc finger protein 1 [Larimichthys crocea]|uniref:Uncharacterized protein n=1 Tax=Larimichthys crocea TaxID=215358 RepID=A0ACD3QQ86_LARCR|nr:AN1-type zinc finger protein 1 [Larimichthys crocea]
MITSVRSWWSKSLEWKPQKSWCKRLLVSHGVERENFFCHSFVCPHGISIKQNDLIFVITHVRLFVFVQPCLHIYSVCLRPCDHSESKDGSKSKGRRGAKNSATAAKVALMKLKLHAAGDKGLPQTERTYFQVYLPKEAKDSSQPMFFCSKWSVGKVVDYAASLASLKNNNNILTAKKLRLCHPQTGEAFRMDDTVLSLLAHPDSPLYNGGNVILEYLDNECTGLEDVSEYITQS